MTRERLQTGAEWDALFDVAAPTELERACRVEPVAAKVGQLVYRTRTIKAGPVTECEIYPVYGRQQETHARKARENLSPERVQRANHAAAIRRIIRLANANFGDEDLHVTLTYQDNPPDWDRAQKDVRNFLLKVKRLREKREMDALKYIYTIEGDEDGTKERIHIHLLMNGDMDREELERIWAKGYANADRLRPDENGLEAIARYIAKQQRNRRRWCASRNLKQPKSRTSESRCRNSQVKRIAFNMQSEAKEQMEKIYPGYQFVKCSVRFSDVINGAYIRCVMRKKE